MALSSLVMFDYLKIPQYESEWNLLIFGPRLLKSQSSLKQTSKPDLWFGDISLLAVSVSDVLVNIVQDEFHGFFKVGNISHLKLGSISQEGDHITVSEQSLDSSDFDNVWVNNLGHVLSSDSRSHTDATGSDSVSNPSLAGPRCGSGDDSDNSKDGDGGDDSLSDGRRALIEFFFRGECDGGLGCLGRSCGSTLSLSTLGLGGSSSQHLRGFQGNFSSFLGCGISFFDGSFFWWNKDGTFSCLWLFGEKCTTHSWSNDRRSKRGKSLGILRGKSESGDGTDDSNFLGHDVCMFVCSLK
mmetsp:Transcript_21012/g.51642  ORF Transcript_21012/g.51642 Transcript_21012/m.51642 type:complete len:298 (+) Transcript_21012:78-971(+)